MTIASEISRLQWAKADIKTAIENKWVTVWNITLDNYPSCIDAIPTWADVAVVDFLLLWWWGGWWKNRWWWWWAGWVIVWEKYALEKGSYPVTIWWWWIGSGLACNWNWCSSCFVWFVALWWWHGGTCCCPWWDWASWWWAWGKNSVVWKAQQCLYVQWNSWGAWNSYWHWWGGWWFWGAWCCCSSGYGWDGGIWYLTSMTWHEECFAWWWWWAVCWIWQYWWWCWYNKSMTPTTCWSWWWWHCQVNNGWKWAWWVLIIAYPSDCGYNISWATCSCVCNWVCVHCFTSSWTLTVS